MHKKVFKALEDKVHDLHDADVFYITGGEHEQVVCDLARAVGTSSDETEIRDALRKEMNKQRRKEIVFGRVKKETIQDITDVVIAALREVKANPEPEIDLGYGWMKREDVGEPEDLVRVDRGDWLRVSDGKPTQAPTIIRATTWS